MSADIRAQFAADNLRKSAEFFIPDNLRESAGN